MKSSLGPMPLDLNLRPMDSITIRSNLKSFHTDIKAYHTDLKADRTVIEPIELSWESDGRHIIFV